MLLAVGLIMLAIFGVVAWQVDDWARDLTTNRAATSVDASDTSLRSLELSASAEKVQAAILQFIERSESWEIGVGEDASDEEDGEVILLVRRSRLFRFADDVHVFLQPTAAGTRIDVASQSRVGKGDLGQNPRNIRELLQAIRKPPL